MSWSDYVSGGVGPAALKVEAGGGDREIVFPETAELTERFEAITVRRVALNGEVLDLPRGFRYHARLRLGWLDVDGWRRLAAAFAAWRAGARWRFVPHTDCPGIAYDVAPACEFSFGYVAGKYLGYAGQLELMGTALTRFIPAPWQWRYFCSVAEAGYGTGETTYFTAAGENYNPGEESHFSPAEIVG